MTNYHVTIIGDRYPTEYNVEATGWPTAIARAIREWKKRFKGNRSEVLSIRAVKLPKLITTE